MRIFLTSDLHAGFDRNTDVIHRKFFKDVSKLEFDLIILAGDNISHSQHATKTLFRNIRESIDKPVVACSGNHDFWDNSKYKMDYPELISKRNEIYKIFDIHHVDFGPIETKGVAILGFDGWYGYSNPGTQDSDMINSCYSVGYPHQYLSAKAHSDALNTTDQAKEFRNKGLKTVGVTHFPMLTESYTYIKLIANMQLMPLMKESFDVLCVGHSHKECDFTEDGTRFLNAGSDYNKPRYKIFEI